MPDDKQGERPGLPPGEEVERSDPGRAGLALCRGGTLSLGQMTGVVAGQSSLWPGEETILLLLHPRQHQEEPPDRDGRCWRSLHQQDEIPPALEGQARHDPGAVQHRHGGERPPLPCQVRHKILFYWSCIESEGRGNWTFWGSCVGRMRETVLWWRVWRLGTSSVRLRCCPPSWPLRTGERPQATLSPHSLPFQKWNSKIPSRFGAAEKVGLRVTRNRDIEVKWNERKRFSPDSFSCNKHNDSIFTLLMKNHETFKEARKLFFKIFRKHL